MDGVGSGVAASLRAVDCAATATAQAAFGRLFGTDGAMLPVLTILLTLYIAFFAFSLITGRSRIIGLVVAYLENYFYPEAIERLSVALVLGDREALADMGYTPAEAADTVSAVLDLPPNEIDSWIGELRAAL